MTVKRRYDCHWECSTYASSGQRTWCGEEAHVTVHESTSSTHKSLRVAVVESTSASSQMSAGLPSSAHHSSSFLRTTLPNP